jgi:hypothetical protein
VDEGPIVPEYAGPDVGREPRPVRGWVAPVVALAASPLVTFPLAGLLYRLPQNWESVYYLSIWLIPVAPSVAFGYALSVFRRSVHRPRHLAAAGMALCLASMVCLIWFVNRD